MDEEIALQKRLDYLRQKKWELDDEIDALSVSEHNEFETKRKKKEKLMLNDEILRLQAILYPDIIA